MCAKIMQFYVGDRPDQINLFQIRLSHANYLSQYIPLQNPR